MSDGINIELARTAEILVRDFLLVKPGEDLLITADRRSDLRVVDATAQAGHAAGAKVAVIMMRQIPYGGLGDPYIPKSVEAALAASDVWVEFNFPPLTTSTPFEKAMATNRVRHLLNMECGVDNFIRLFGRIEVKSLVEIQRRASEVVARSKGGRMTTPVGTDFTFENDPKRPVRLRGICDKPGYNSPIGLVSWAPIEESIRGTVKLESLVLDEYDSGILSEPVNVEVDGRIKRIQGGGRHGERFERFVRRVTGGTLGNIIHIGVGVHPAATATGNCFNEDIRQLGNAPVGFGYQFKDFGGGRGGAVGGSAHPDGLLTRISLWLDGSQIIDRGKFVGPGDLVELIQKAEETASSR